MAVHPAYCHSFSLVTLKYLHMVSLQTPQLRLMLRKASEQFIKTILASIGFLSTLYYTHCYNI